MTTHRRRRIVTTLLWILPLQLLAGGALILRAQIMPVTVVEQKLTDEVSSINERLKKLDDLHLEGRLAVLDKLSDRSERTEYLVVGLFLTTAGQLLLQAWVHRSRNNNHAHGRFDDDGEQG
jgi:hypothetical protein